MPIAVTALPLPRPGLDNGGMSNAPPKRRWYQFSLLTLLVMMTVATLAFGGWVQYRRQRARENRDRVARVQGAVAEFEKFDGFATPEYKELRPQTWLEKQFNDPGDLNDPVNALGLTIEFFNDAETTYAGLEYLKGLTEIRELYIGGLRNHDLPTVKADLKHLKELTNLRKLTLESVNIADDDLKHLNGLVELETLMIHGVNISDAGLDHLKLLTNLQYLHVFNTKVTESGVKKLQQALPNCEIAY
jgi:hypothetical protein